VVLGVELVPRLVAWGAKNLASTGFGWARIREATPGVVGAPDEAPYDRILVSADGGSVPGALVDQLTEDGRMVLPAAGRLVLVVRAGDRTATSEHGHYRFVPLR
jgi:protein-L-isoaspartate(D-aspartate) O-methyltransferase